MSVSPILLVHICAGSLGLVSGAVAMSFRKGSPRHARAGEVFVVSMLTIATAATYLAIMKHQPSNVGSLTFYLIMTAWLTARRVDGETSKFDYAAVLVPLAIGALTWISGLEKVRSPAPPKDGVPAECTFSRVP